MKDKKFSLKARLASFKNAGRGLSVFIGQGGNVWIHCTMTVLVILAGWLLKISPAEWIAVVIAIGLVFAAEAFNSSVEKLSDVVQPERDDRIRDVKDISAGAVLICVITASVIGLVVFLPKLIALF